MTAGGCGTSVEQGLQVVDEPPRLFLGVVNGGSSPNVIELEPDTLDRESLAAILAYVEERVGDVHLEVRSLHHWPDESRYLLLTLIQQVGERAVVQIGGAGFADPFEAVLAAMVGAENLTTHTRSLRAAREAAALFHPDAAEAAADRINNRLEQLGARKVRVTTLARDIRRLTGADGDTPPLDPADAARGFLEALAADMSVPAGRSPLHHYRSTFYRQDGNRWASIDTDALAARVTGWLQERGVPRIGRRLVQDVLVNLQGLADVRVDHPGDMPFYLANSTGAEDTDRRLLVFDNGMVDLERLLAGGAAELLDYDPRWFSRTALPFGYDPAARCPRFLQFLNQVLPRTAPGDHRQLVVQAFAGYCFLGDCQFERMLILWGNGSNGKSVTLKVLARLLGEDNVEHIAFDQLTNEFRLGSLIGKSANVSMELNHMGRANEAILRSIISGEPQTVSRKFLTDIKTKLFAKLMAGTNELPSFADPTEATWRRLLIVPFEVRIDDRQANRALVDELAEELPGIFNWALRGLRKLVRKNRFPACVKCDAAVAGHRRDSDSVKEFLAECCSPASGWQPHSQPLYEIYHFYCDLRQRKAVAENEFGKRMKRAGFTKRRGSAQPDGSRPRVYLGLRIRPDFRWLVSRYVRKERPGWDLFPYAATGEA